MKKTIFTLIAAGFGTLPLSAQVTLDDASSYNALIGTDTTREINIATSGSVENYSIPQTNYTWDLTELVYQSGFNTYTRSAANISGNQMSKNIVYPFGALTYIVKGDYIFDNDGLFKAAEVVAYQGNTLAPLTGDVNDSLVFPDQIVNFSAPLMELTFPASYNTTWSSTVKYNTNFKLTVNAYGIVNTPGERRTTYTIKDTVVGWGKMKVQDKNGDESGLMDVLQVRHWEQAVDSFYLGGMPAPGSLLTAFGISQGMATSNSEVMFYRPNELTPLLWVKYSDNTMTTPIIMETSRTRLAEKTTGIHGIASENGFKLYPNPVTNRTLNVEVPEAGKWSYELIAMNGQRMTGGALSFNTGVKNTSIALPYSILPGYYSVILMDDKGNRKAQPIFIAD
jgi:hypothetical protein